MVLIWSDIETNGDPDPIEGLILEVGFYITEQEPPFGFLGSVGYVVDPGLIPYGSESITHDLFHTPKVYKMHRESKLLDLIEAGIGQPLKKAEEECIELISRFCEPGEGIMAGRGITWFDSVWIKEQMPDLHAMFHPKQRLDLSGFSAVLRYGELEHLESEHKDTHPHRAVHDAATHYEEFLGYVETLKDR